MPKNYTTATRLIDADVAHLMQIYHQAYREKYPYHQLPFQDNRFWQTENKELIFYAGQVTKELSVIKRLYKSTLDVMTRLLELDIAQFDFSGLYVVMLHQPQHEKQWSSVVLSIEDINRESYQKIYQRYQEFKQYLQERKVLFLLNDSDPAKRQQQINLFVQYATDNRHGYIREIRNKTDIEILLESFFKQKAEQDASKSTQDNSEQKQSNSIFSRLTDLLNGSRTPGSKSSTTEDKVDADNYQEGNLRLIFSSNQVSGGTGVRSFGPYGYAKFEHQRAWAKFDNANNQVKCSSKTVMSTEEAVLGALRYAFGCQKNHSFSSQDLRKVTNYFCPEFAKLFLFDYNLQTYRRDYQAILQKKEQERHREESTRVAKDSANKTLMDRVFLFIRLAIYAGMGLTGLMFSLPFVMVLMAAIACLGIGVICEYILHLKKISYNLQEEEQQLEKQDFLATHTEEGYSKPYISTSVQTLPSMFIPSAPPMIDLPEGNTFIPDWNASSSSSSYNDNNNESATFELENQDFVRLNQSNGHNLFL